MPFQSEKQRRYLWANEPEIARDWTDTYGSRIQKNEGGLTSIRQGYFSGGDIIKMGLKHIVTSQAKKKAQEYGYLPQSTQKKGMGWLGKMLATMFLGPAAGLAWDVGSGILSNRKGSSFASNFNMPGFSRSTTPQQQATQRFMQNYNVGINPQTGRMTSGPFAGKNAPGSSMFGSKTPQEMAQKWMSKYGKMDYKTEKMMAKQKEIRDLAAGNTNEPPGQKTFKPQVTPKHSPHQHHHGGGGGGQNGTGGKGSSPSDAAGTPFNRGGLADLWQR